LKRDLTTSERLEAGFKVRNMQDTTRKTGCGNNNVWKGFAAGLIAGLVASWTMNRFQGVWSKLAEGIEPWPDNQFQNVWAEFAEGLEESHGSQVSKLGPNPEVQEDTTVRAASAVAESLFNHKLTQSEKKIAGPAVHYILGTGVGGLYGAAAEIAPKVTAGTGLPFGAVFWLVVDEGAVPLLGLSKGPTAYSVSTHAYALSSHFVYGLTAEIVRRAIRKAM
jgi:putative membrane protein